MLTAVEPCNLTPLYELVELLLPVRVMSPEPVETVVLLIRMPFQVPVAMPVKVMVPVPEVVTPPEFSKRIPSP